MDLKSERAQKNLRKADCLDRLKDIIYNKKKFLTKGTFFYYAYSAIQQNQ